MSSVRIKWLASIWICVGLQVVMAQDCSDPAPLCFVQFNNITVDSTGNGPLMADLNCANPAMNGTLYQITTIAPGDFQILLENIQCDTAGNQLGDGLILTVYDSADPCNPGPASIIACEMVSDQITLDLTAATADQNFYVAIYGDMEAGDSGPADCGYELQTSGEAVEFALTVPSVQYEILLGQSVDIEGVTGVEEYLWSGSGQITEDTMANPTITPNGIGEFTYQVMGTQGDCEVTEEVTILVQPNIIPADVITPNGDGINDEWYVLFLDERFDRADVRIFDRWGQVVYKSIGYGVTQLWDGTNNGNRLPAGAYYYVIDLKTSESGEGPVFTGAVNVIY
ncbi:MAG: gliding motility-associated C-terminal domain-containing protein [Flavobacteriales bacterium]|nr:gliding motility-associated C-terminal domain-containing protein [Flavobacteriales bacterium]